jgi:hypothetical protein
MQRGIKHPAKQLTRKTWHETLVKGIVEDDLPYLLVEKRGIQWLKKLSACFDVFHYL